MMEELIDILLVEDNPEDANLTIRALRRNDLTSRILHLSDGAEALQYLFCQGAYRNRKISDLPKLILLDLKMPKMSGLEVLKIIKANEQTRSAPVVILTSSNQNSDIERCLHHGANSYVVKPVDFDSFMKVITAVGNYWVNFNQNIQQEDV